MKITHVLAYYGDYIGGMQGCVRELAKRQKTAGHDVSVLTSDQYGSQTKIDGINVVRVKAWINAFRVPFTPSLPVKLLTDKCDVLHIHVPLPWLDICATLKKIVHPKTKLIVSIHNYIPVNSTLSKALAFIHDKLTMRVLLHFADSIITSSLEFAESLTYTLPTKKLSIIPLGVDTNLFKPKSKFNNNQILFVGRLIPEKGLHVLMKAMELVLKKRPNAKLLAICGENYNYQDYEREIRKMDTGFLTILKNVPNEQMPKYYASSACFVMPSIDIDSFGIVILEALASGCPVVVTDLAGPMSIAKKGKGMVVKKGNHSELASAIIQTLHKSPKVRKEVRQYVVNNFSWDIVFGKTMKVYSSPTNQETLL